MGFNKVELVVGSAAQLTFESDDTSFDALYKIAMKTIVELIALNDPGDSDTGNKPDIKKDSLIKSEIPKALGHDVVTIYQ